MTELTVGQHEIGLASSNLLRGSGQPVMLLNTGDTQRPVKARLAERVTKGRGERCDEVSAPRESVETLPKVGRARHFVAT